MHVNDIKGGKRLNFSKKAACLALVVDPHNYCACCSQVVKSSGLY